MTLENQVCSLELSKRLKELGVKQVSLFYWFFLNGKWYVSDKDREGYREMVSAFTVAELGEMLPNYVSTSNCGGGRHSERVDYLVCENQNAREAWIRGTRKEYICTDFRDKNEANARAKMLIYLLENELIEVVK